MDKRLFSERDICSKIITPALIQAGWDLNTQISEEKTLTDGRIIVRGRMVARGRQKRADYVLYLKPNIPIAVIEAKDNKYSVGHGMQQALTYAEMLRIPFAFSSSGCKQLFRLNLCGYLGPMARKMAQRCDNRRRSWVLRNARAQIPRSALQASGAMPRSLPWRGNGATLWR